jgi:hypothetical protein
VTRREVFQAALALPDEERAELIEELEASFEGKLEVNEAFVAMINERVAAVERGEPGIPAEDVFTEARRR